MSDFTACAGQKDFLRALLADGSLIQDTAEPFALVKALLPNLGSSDEEVRDILTYPLLALLIVDEQEQYHLTGEQLEELFLTVIDGNHLFFHVGEAGTDSVFLRSFSALMIPLLFIADAGKRVVSEQVARRVFDALLSYAREERDWRGYVKGKGWAHAIAHLADALDDCSKNRFMTTADCEAILMTLTYLAQLPEPLGAEEDDRLAFVAYGIITRQAVELAFFKQWIASLVVARADDALNEEGAQIASRATNAKNFLRSLYFLLKWHKVPVSLEQKIDLLVAIDAALQGLSSLPSEWFVDTQQDESE